MMKKMIPMVMTLMMTVTKSALKTPSLDSDARHDGDDMIMLTSLAAIDADCCVCS